MKHRKEAMMASHSENDFVIPALKALYHLGGTAAMSDIKDEIPNYIELTEEDNGFFESRQSRGEARYRQVVGNINSHHNDTFFKYVEKNEDKTFSLNLEGKKYIEELEGTHEHTEDENETIVYDESKEQGKNLVNEASISSIDSKILKYAEKKGLDARPADDQKIKETILEISGRKCQYAAFVGEIHPTITGKDGKPYVVGHHLIPLSARKDFFPRNLDRASNIVCLCPNCHDIIHHGTIEDKTKVLKVLYERFIDELNDEQIYITFDELMDKYYK